MRYVLKGQKMKKLDKLKEGLCRIKIEKDALEIKIKNLNKEIIKTENLILSETKKQKPRLIYRGKKI